MQQWHEPLRTISEPQFWQSGPSSIWTIAENAWTGSVFGPGPEPLSSPLKGFFHNAVTLRNAIAENASETNGFFRA
jgi:hypothetical protein